MDLKHTGPKNRLVSEEGIMMTLWAQIFGSSWDSIVYTT